MPTIYIYYTIRVTPLDLDIEKIEYRDVQNRQQISENVSHVLVWSTKYMKFVWIKFCCHLPINRPNECKWKIIQFVKHTFPIK